MRISACVVVIMVITFVCSNTVSGVADSSDSRDDSQYQTTSRFNSENTNVKRYLRTLSKLKGEKHQGERHMSISTNNRLQFYTSKILIRILAKLYTLTPMKIMEILRLRETPRRQYVLHMTFVQFVKRRCRDGLRWKRCHDRMFQSNQ
ncbi:RxLR effector protein [Phytophthora megakarya]|uniref:RxLR effector protein n=1 Tax=Phytophthora megakarya TaxID=4795 RepID=A0A225WVE5_9STRA|nr:RxLR effector protein [Phytophthora megakarya]